MNPWQAIESEHPRLVNQFELFWDHRLEDYAASLFQARPKEIDPDFLSVLQTQAQDIGYSADETQMLVSQLQQLPVVQTSHHVTPTHGPGFASIDLISLAGLKPGQIYPIFATSGLPFSNSAWSGALSYGELKLEQLTSTGLGEKKMMAAQSERKAHGSKDQRYSLIPAKWRDHLVFAAQQTGQLAQALGGLAPSLQSLCATVQLERPWSYWAVKTAAQIQSQLFDQKVMIFDLNGLVADYLALKLEKGDPGIRGVFGTDEFKQSLDFFLVYQGKKSFKLARGTWSNNQLWCEKSELHIKQIEGLIRAFRSRQVCPGLWLSFLVVRFILGLKCLGSFNQIEYIEQFRLSLLGSSISKQLDLSDYSKELTTGRLWIDQKELWPLDWVLAGRRLDLSALRQRAMSSFWQPVVERLQRVPLA